MLGRTRHAITTERNPIEVGDDLPLEILGPLRCGSQTGVGAVVEHPGAERRRQHRDSRRGLGEFGGTPRRRPSRVLTPVTPADYVSDRVRPATFSEQAVSPGLRDDLRTITSIELHHDVVQVCLNGIQGQAQSFAYLAIRIPGRDQP